MAPSGLYTMLCHAFLVYCCYIIALMLYYSIKYFYFIVALRMFMTNNYIQYNKFLNFFLYVLKVILTVAAGTK